MIPAWEILAEPFRYPFMLRALAVGVMVGVMGGVIGSFLVVRRWALLGDAIAHSVLPGVAISYVLGLPFFLGALVTGMATALGIGFVERNTRIKADAAMGVLFIGAFAIGLAILSKVRTSVDVFHILFGNVLGVAVGDVVLTAVVGTSVVLAVGLLFKELRLWAFDPLTAEVSGLPVRRLHYLLMLLVSATIVASLKAVGVVLALAVLVIPPVTAYLVTNRLSHMIVVAAALGALSAVIGLYLSFYLDLASGPAMVLVATAAFVLALVVAPEQGLAARLLRRQRVARQVATEDVLKVLERLGAGERSVSMATTVAAAGVGENVVRGLIRRLVRSGLVSAGDDGVRLTDAGLRRARSLIRSHRLWERYLTDVAGMPMEAVHSQAHDLEHVTPPGLADELAEALGHPVRDPHGSPIPSAEGALPDGQERSLAAIPDGMPVEVVRLDPVDDAERERLARVGIEPGARVRVARTQDARLLVRRDADDGGAHGGPGEAVPIPVEKAIRILVRMTPGDAAARDAGGSVRESGSAAREPAGGGGP